MAQLFDSIQLVDHGLVAACGLNFDKHDLHAEMPTG
jgi:hypothetical protein